MNLLKKNLKWTTGVLALAMLFSCKDDNGMDHDNNIGPDLVVYGLTANNELVSFNANSPGNFLSKEQISGLAGGEKLWSIDFRPATGELYALSSASKIYLINLNSTKATAVAAASFAPAVEGTYASIDFNPTVDRIRLVSNTGQNLRLHPETAALSAEDTDINAVTGTAVISGVAYTNSKAGATSTVLFDVDGSAGKLFKQLPPNDGKLVEVGALGFTFEGQTAFDISADNSAALLAGKSGNSNGLYLVNTESGKAEMIGRLSAQIIDLAIPTEPVAYAVDADNNLHILTPGKTGVVTLPIKGLSSGENIKGIDFRPANGQLYALGSTSRLYTINLATGDAGRVGTLPFFPLLSGQDFGFDFNPTVDRIRLVSNTGQNLRLHPETGVVAGIDGNLNPETPRVSAAAYTNNFAGSTATTLFVVDHNSDKLYTQIPPNDGKLVEVGSLGIDISSANGFDIGGNSDKAYLAATVAGSTKIYQINITTGAATAWMDLPVPVTGFAIGLGF